MNDLEELFNRQPPYSEEDLEKVITHYREQRARYLAGEKPKKATGQKETSVDLAALGLGKPKVPVGKIKLI